MKAMILAAGLGTRLRPLTDTRPKALVEINGRTLLEITLSRLRSFGIIEVIINVHHFADVVIDYLKSNNNFGTRIEISREDDLLLDTGGGLKKAAWFFLEHSQRAAKKKPSTVIPSAARNPGNASIYSDSGQKPDASGNADEPFFLHNVDVISTIDLHRMLQFHTENHALATLAVQSRESSRLLLFDDQLRLCGRRIGSEDTVISSQPHASQTGEKVSATVIPRVATSARQGARVPSLIRRDLLVPKKENRPSLSGPEIQCASSQTNANSRPGSPSPLQALAFSGIHVISPRFLRMMREEGVFSVIDTYLRLAAQGEKILAFRADEYYWRDLGRPSDLSQAAHDLQQKVIP